MARRGAQQGNNNAAKGRTMSKHLRQRIEDRKLWCDLMDALLAKALEGDITAIKEVFDRIDGKPKQAIVGGDEDDAPIKIARIELVALSDDSES